MVFTWDLTLLHVNDIHVRMDETNKYSSNCKQKDVDAGEFKGKTVQRNGCFRNLFLYAAILKRNFCPSERSKFKVKLYGLLLSF